MKKALIFLVIVIVAGVVVYTLTTKWRGNDNRDYANTKYGYSLQYPAEWNMRGSAQSDILQFFTADNPPGDGGLPDGIKMEVMVLENYDNLDLDTWVEQMTMGGMGGDEIRKDKITVGGINAIRVTSEPMFEEEGEPLGVYLKHGNNIVLINYMGSEPDYSNNLGGFETVLHSIILTIE
ncbi:hypothetical protein KKF55_06085 [Patescibacteria group bacterium]|nr:hypothetical protein [Patescibacteria group bacterium]